MDGGAAVVVVAVLAAPNKFVFNGVVVVTGAVVVVGAAVELNPNEEVLDVDEVPNNDLGTPSAG